MAKSRPAYFRAKAGFATMLDGELTHVPAGELVSAGHPLLKRREELFEPVTSFGRYDTGSEPVVEQATAAPGEKRTTSRKRRTTRSTPASAPAVKEEVPVVEPDHSFGLKTSHVGEPQP